MRSTQLARIWRLLSLVESRRTGTSAPDLARTLGVSVRTAYRDLETLERLGVPLVRERDGTATIWRILETHRLAQAPSLCLSEIVALTIAGRCIAREKNAPWLPPLSAAIAKLTAVVPTALLQNLARELEGSEADAHP